MAKIRYYKDPLLVSLRFVSRICELERSKMTAVILQAIFEPAIASSDTSKKDNLELIQFSKFII